MPAPAHPGRRRARLVVLGAALALVNVVWNGTAGVAPMSFPPVPTETPLRIVEARTRAAPDRGLAVEVTVRNTGTSPHRGRVWWQLATPGPEDAWSRRVYESAYRSVALAGGGQATLRWTEQPLVPAGRYDVHAWARVRRGGTLQASDGRAGTPPGAELAGNPELLRHRPAPDGAAVSAVATTLHPQGARSRVTITNPEPRSRHGWLRWSVATVDGRDPASWWRWIGSVPPGQFKEIAVSPHQHVVVELDHGRPPGPGRYAVRVSLAFDRPARPPGAPDRDDDVAAFFTVGPLPGLAGP